MTQLRLLSSLAALMGLLPCAAHALTDSEPLSMVFESSADASAGGGGERPNGPAPSVSRVVQTCTLYIAGIEDARLNKADAGNLTLMKPTVHATPLAAQSLKSGDARPWVRDALRATQRYGFQSVMAAPSVAGGTHEATMEVALRLAHAWSTGLNLVSHVVLQVSYRLPIGEVVTRQYHGMGTRTNFANGNGEFMSVLNSGLETAVSNMTVDAAALCEGKPLPAPPAP